MSDPLDFILFKRNRVSSAPINNYSMSSNATLSRINAADRVAVKVQGGLCPTVASTYDLGAEGLEWRDVYADSLISGNTVVSDGSVSGLSAPTSASDAANKAYVDSVVESGGTDNAAAIASAVEPLETKVGADTKIAAAVDGLAPTEYVDDAVAPLATTAALTAAVAPLASKALLDATIVALQNLDLAAIKMSADPVIHPVDAGGEGGAWLELPRSDLKNQARIPAFSYVNMGSARAPPQANDPDIVFRNTLVPSQSSYGIGLPGAHSNDVWGTTLHTSTVTSKHSTTGAGKIDISRTDADTPADPNSNYTTTPAWSFNSNAGGGMDLLPKQPASIGSAAEPVASVHATAMKLDGEDVASKQYAEEFALQSVLNDEMLADTVPYKLIMSGSSGDTYSLTVSLEGFIGDYYEDETYLELRLFIERNGPAIFHTSTELFPDTITGVAPPVTVNFPADGNHYTKTHFALVMSHDRNMQYPDGRPMIGPQVKLLMAGSYDNGPYGSSYVKDMGYANIARRDEIDAILATLATAESVTDAIAPLATSAALAAAVAPLASTTALNAAVAPLATTAALDALEDVVDGDRLVSAKLTSDPATTPVETSGPDGAWLTLPRSDLKNQSLAPAFSYANMGPMYTPPQTNNPDIVFRNTLVPSQSGYGIGLPGLHPQDIWGSSIHTDRVTSKNSTTGSGDIRIARIDAVDPLDPDTTYNTTTAWRFASNAGGGMDLYPEQSGTIGRVANPVGDIHASSVKAAAMTIDSKAVATQEYVTAALLDVVPDPATPIPAFTSINTSHLDRSITVTAVVAGGNNEDIESVEFYITNAGNTDLFNAISRTTLQGQKASTKYKTTLTGLLPDTSYTLWYIATGKSGKQTALASLAFTTLPGIYSAVPPTSVNVNVKWLVLDGVFTDTLRITWDSPVNSSDAGMSKVWVFLTSQIQGLAFTGSPRNTEYDYLAIQTPITPNLGSSSYEVANASMWSDLTVVVSVSNATGYYTTTTKRVIPPPSNIRSPYLVSLTSYPLPHALDDHVTGTYSILNKGVVKLQGYESGFNVPGYTADFFVDIRASHITNVNAIPLPPEFVPGETVGVIHPEQGAAPSWHGLPMRNQYFGAIFSPLFTEPIRTPYSVAINTHPIPGSATQATDIPDAGLLPSMQTWVKYTTVASNTTLTATSTQPSRKYTLSMIPFIYNDGNLLEPQSPPLTEPDVNNDAYWQAFNTVETDAWDDEIEYVIPNSLITGWTPPAASTDGSNTYVLVKPADVGAPTVAFGDTARLVGTPGGGMGAGLPFIPGTTVTTSPNWDNIDNSTRDEDFLFNNKLYWGGHTLPDGPFLANYGGAQAWIQIVFEEAKTVTQYTLWGWGRGSSSPPFYLKGSNDGVSWTTLHSELSATIPIVNVPSDGSFINASTVTTQNLSRTVTTPGSYTRYRIEITASPDTGTQPYHAIGEIKLEWAATTNVTSHPPGHVFDTPTVRQAVNSFVAANGGSWVMPSTVPATAVLRFDSTPNFRVNVRPTRDIQFDINGVGFWQYTSTGTYPKQVNLANDRSNIYTMVMYKERNAEPGADLCRIHIYNGGGMIHDLDMSTNLMPLLDPNQVDAGLPLSTTVLIGAGASAQIGVARHITSDTPIDWEYLARYYASYVATESPPGLSW